MKHELPTEVCDLISGFFSLLSHPTRIRIFCALQDGPLTVSELAAHAHIPLSNASQHLRLMRDKGALVARKHGQNVYYHIGDPRFVQASMLIRDTLLQKMQSQTDRMASAMASTTIRPSGPAAAHTATAPSSATTPL